MMLSSQRPDDSLTTLSQVRKQSTSIMHKSSRFLAAILLLAMWMALSPATSYAANHITVKIHTTSTHPSYRIYYILNGVRNTNPICEEEDGNSYTVDAKTLVSIHANTGSRCDGSINVEHHTPTESTSYTI
jgi:hypothetical protein